MKMIRRSLAVAELLLIFPAILFMTALFVRNLQPEQYEPARTAQRIVTWYATQPPHFGLWVLLMALPFTVFVTGCATLMAAWRNVALQQAARQVVAALRAHMAILLVAVATAAAASILAIVALHVLTD